MVWRSKSNEPQAHERVNYDLEVWYKPQQTILKNVLGGCYFQQLPFFGIAKKSDTAVVSFGITNKMQFSVKLLFFSISEEDHLLKKYKFEKT